MHEHSGGLHRLAHSTPECCRARKQTFSFAPMPVIQMVLMTSRKRTP